MEGTEEKPLKVCQYWAERLITRTCKELSERVNKLESVATFMKWAGRAGFTVLILLIGFFFGQNGDIAIMKNDIKNIKENVNRIIVSKDGKSIVVMPLKKSVSYCDVRSVNKYYK